MGETFMGWHWTVDDDRLRNGVPMPELGEWYAEDDAQLCIRGLHASEQILQAHRYVQGPWLHRVEVGGKVRHAADKMVGTMRRRLWTVHIGNALKEAVYRLTEECFDYWDAPLAAIAFFDTRDIDLAKAAGRACAEAREELHDLSKKTERRLKKIEKQVEILRAQQHEWFFEETVSTEGLRKEYQELRQELLRIHVAGQFADHTLRAAKLFWHTTRAMEGSKLGWDDGEAYILGHFRRTLTRMHDAGDVWPDVTKRGSLRRKGDEPPKPSDIELWIEEIVEACVRELPGAGSE